MTACIVGFVVDTVKQHAVKEAEALVEVGDKIMHLNDRLEWLQTFVRDADQKRRSKENPFVAVWVRQTRDVAFEMEDVLDDYLCKTFLAEMERSWWDSCLKFITHPFSQLFILDDLVKRMNKIEERLTDISTNKDGYNIQSLGEPSSVWTSSSTTNLAAWDNMEELMIPFDGNEERLKKELIDLGGTDSLKMISISGESGSGKTKLIGKIFNSEEVQKHFRKRSWTLLPPKYRVTDILGKIHKQVKTQVPHGVNIQSYEGNEISNMLMYELDEGPYLVVLDGMASITDWNIIKVALPDKRNGSRVLIIMQSDSGGVENFVDPALTKLQIEPLDRKKSIRLFLNRVFGENKPPSWFEETKFDFRYGKDVFTLTQGLPLAIVILAGLLRSKESQAEWNFVFELLKDVKGAKALDRILAMSFDDLPLSLKSCFLYLGALPETKLYDGHKLVRLWISEGFIKPKKGKTLEEIGQQHLKELVSRCLVKLVSKDAEGDVELIVIHSPVHVFVQSEAQAASFFEIHDNVDVIAPSTVRRLSVQNHTDKYVPLRNLFPKLRSLICDFAENEVNTNVLPQINQKYHTLRFLHASKFLRVIDLQGLLLESLPKEIGSMIYLRYIGVKNCGLKRLPTSIDSLIYLQTLDVKDTDASNVSEKFWDIPTLRHIFALNIKPPKYMKVKENLQTLHGISCTNRDAAFLEKAVNLRSLEIDVLSLGIEGLSYSHSDVLLVALKKLELLVDLKLKCSNGAYVPLDIFDVSILRRLQCLEIDGRIEKAQEQESMHRHSNSSTLPNLTVLILRQTKLCQEFIFKLADFPRLSVLKLEMLSYHGETLVFPENGFQGLTELHLCLDMLRDWKIEKSVMPNLVKLYFWNCWKLKLIPDAMKGLSNLKEVMVYNSPKIAKRIGKLGLDPHKVNIRVPWNDAKKN